MIEEQNLYISLKSGISFDLYDYLKNRDVKPFIDRARAPKVITASIHTHIDYFLNDFCRHLMCDS